MSLSQVTILSEIIHVADGSPMSRYPLLQEYVIVDPNTIPMGARTEPWRSSLGLTHDLPIRENKTKQNLGLGFGGLLCFILNSNLTGLAE